MVNKRLLLIISVSTLFIGCSDVRFLGAQKYQSKMLYAERWYLSSKYHKKDIPKGTAFYGASAKKIKNKFIIKYYITNYENYSTTEIPKKDMWKIKHNGKNKKEQDDNNLFYYLKDKNKQFVQGNAINSEVHPILPILSCHKNGWCELYPNYLNKTLYIKKSILDKPLSEINE